MRRHPGSEPGSAIRALRALILTAGLGTRLRPLTRIRAKAAVPVNGEPLVRRVVSWLVGQGFDDLVLNLHHRPATICRVLGDGGDLGARVRYSWEHPVLGSAGGPRHALPLLVDGRGRGEERFLIVNGDTLTDFDLAAFGEVHRASGALVTMALVPNPRPDVYGGVLVSGGRVVGFGRRGEVPAGADSFHFIGVQVAEARVFSKLPDGVPAESVMQVYPKLIAENRRAIAAHVIEARFRDVGTPADYLQTALDLSAVEGDRLVSQSGVRIHTSARVQRTAIWENVTIGAEARLDECIVCDGAHVPDGSSFRRCAIAPHLGEGPEEGEHLWGDLVVRVF